MMATIKKKVDLLHFFSVIQVMGYEWKLSISNKLFVFEKNYLAHE
jgi:hypothetical protein